VVGQKQHRLAVHLGGHARTLLGAVGKAVIVVVVGNPAVEAQGGLHARLDAPAFDRAQGCRVGHVRVQYGCCRRVAQMDLRMDVQRCFFDRPFTFEDAACGIDEQQVARAHLGPMRAPRIDQKPVGSDLQAEMVAGPFVETQTRRPAERGGKVDAGSGKIGHWGLVGCGGERRRPLYCTRAALC